ncbi:Catalase-peroxidase [Dirofilaria immitis]
MIEVQKFDQSDRESCDGDNNGDVSDGFYVCADVGQLDKIRFFENNRKPITELTKYSWHFLSRLCKCDESIFPLSLTSFEYMK